MSRRSTTLLKTALAAVHYTGAGSLLAPYTRGAGVIFMLHQVDPTPPQAFEPNRSLKVTPNFLEDYVKALLSGVPFALMNTLKRYAGGRLPVLKARNAGSAAAFGNLDPSGRGQYHPR